MLTVIAGTNRLNSKTKLVAHDIARRLEKLGVEHRVLDLAELPDVFQPHYYWNTPESFQPVQKLVTQSKKFLVVTPEYNGSFPGALKYFIDLLKFPESFAGKQVAFVGVSAGQGGALRAIDHLQAIFHYLGAHVFGRRVMLPRINEAIDANGAPVEPKVEELLQKMVEEFASRTATR